MLQQNIIKGKILLKSGLHIGGSDAGVKIGGIDSPVIKNPISDEPYIPGSSLKGKIRFLLEHKENIAHLNKGDVPKYEKGKNELIPTIFGNTTDRNHEDNPEFPTRIIVRDANVIGAIKDFNDADFEQNEIVDKNESKALMQSVFSEEKTEVVIDRLTGSVSGHGGPRQIERVPAGTVFEFEIVLRVFKEGEQEKQIEILKQGLKLLENDALGGFGSRGSGRIKFFDLTLDGEGFTLNEVTL